MYFLVALGNPVPGKGVQNENRIRDAGVNAELDRTETAGHGNRGCREDHQLEDVSRPNQNEL